MADTLPTPGLRRQLLAVTATVNAAGQYEPLEVRLPASATRITGIGAVATPQRGQLFERRDAAVVFAPTKQDNPDAVADATVPVPPAVTAAGLGGLGLGTSVRFALSGGVWMAPTKDAYDPQWHVGFFQQLTDELPLQLLNVPADCSVYYAQTVVVGVPRLVDGQGKDLATVTQQGKETVPTIYTVLTGTTGVGAVISTLAYLCRVTPPPSRPGYAYGTTETGYYNGILFPGDASRY